MLLSKPKCEKLFNYSQVQTVQIVHYKSLGHVEWLMHQKYGSSFDTMSLQPRKQVGIKNTVLCMLSEKSRLDRLGTISKRLQ